MRHNGRHWYVASVLVEDTSIDLDPEHVSGYDTASNVTYRKGVAGRTFLTAPCVGTIGRTSKATENQEERMANMGSTLGAGNSLNTDDYLLSADGLYQLILQDDGNLVLYEIGQAKVSFWASNTQGQGAEYAIMQRDGNFVIYDGNTPPNAVWATSTSGSSDCELILKTDTEGFPFLEIFDNGSEPPGIIWTNVP
jgi:hypothetical protein